MIILERPVVVDGGLARHLIVLFGLGLIGRSIATYAKTIFGFGHHTFDYSWGQPTQRSLHSHTIEASILVAARPCPENQTELQKIDFVWAAGKAGFGSSWADIEPELDAFKDVLALCERVSGQLPNIRHAFHLVSSAGGLFEGQRHVNRLSAPSPVRDYGLAKLRQEECLTAASPHIVKLIYRPSSVYGFAGSGVRLGLINTLVQNVSRSKVSHIFGGPHTIRDYVLISDIGKFIVEQMHEPRDGLNTFLLASGKPSSMIEILHKIEAVVGRKIYLQFDLNPSNSSHNSFCQSALPSGWQPTDLTTGIQQTAQQLMNSFVRMK